MLGWGERIGQGGQARLEGGELRHSVSPIRMEPLHDVDAVEKLEGFVHVSL